MANEVDAFTKEERAGGMLRFFTTALLSIPFLNILVLAVLLFTNIPNVLIKSNQRGKDLFTLLLFFLVLPLGALVWFTIGPYDETFGMFAMIATWFIGFWWATGKLMKLPGFGG